MVMSVRIKELVSQASTYEDGQVIFNKIAPAIIAGEKVEISFEGIPAVPSAFINAAIIQLVEVASVQTIREKLAIVNSTKFINDMIRSRFSFATSRP